MTGPADPFDGESDLDVGERLRLAVRAALARGGLVDLYRAVEALDRRDRVAVSLATAASVVGRAVVSSLGDERDDRPREPDDGSGLSEGERLLALLICALIEDGLDGAREAAESLDDRQLKAVVRDGLERNWLERIERREREAGDDG